ncbi:MAG: DUF1801 domain-containing protein [Bacteroidota bacterium]|nr:DUF1801 domain-containing protein [Bacteroidota bacterium]MDP4212427.1 DUF1801 domain-containing protein [Bacteroidota bacterium]MDP4248545.1 DUF1801 domain-containing protein [Bacteroidota bacterium]
MAKVIQRKSIKYEDKSEGQPMLPPIFKELKKMLSKYVKGNYIVRADGPGNYSIYYNKEVVISKKTFPELAFATILIQTGFVGFYFFPAYTNPKLLSDLPEKLLKCLQGKTCFHISKQDPSLMKEISKALEIGYAYYQSKGWK